MLAYRLGWGRRMWKRILMGLGLLTLIGVGGIGALLATAWLGQGEQKQFAEAFVRDLALTWQLETVRERIAEETFSDLDTAATRGGLAVVSNLGRVRQVTEIAMLRHFSSMDTTLRVFAFRAAYDHGDAHGEVVVADHRGRRLIRGFRILPDKPLATTRTSS